MSYQDKVTMGKWCWAHFVDLSPITPHGCLQMQLQLALYNPKALPGRCHDCLQAPISTTQAKLIRMQ